MVDSTRQQASDLIERLATEPFVFDFFRALRLIECRFREKPRIGQSLSPRDDPVRFGQIPSLAFAPSTLAEFYKGEERPAKLSVNFLGLFGPMGRFRCTSRNTRASDSAMLTTRRWWNSSTFFIIAFSRCFTAPGR